MLNTVNLGPNKTGSVIAPQLTERIVHFANQCPVIRNRFVEASDIRDTQTRCTNVTRVAGQVQDPADGKLLGELKMKSEL